MVHAPLLLLPLAPAPPSVGVCGARRPGGARGPLISSLFTLFPRTRKTTNGYVALVLNVVPSLVTSPVTSPDAVTPVSLVLRLVTRLVTSLAFVMAFGAGYGAGNKAGNKHFDGFAGYQSSFYPGNPLTTKKSLCGGGGRSGGGARGGACQGGRRQEEINTVALKTNRQAPGR